MIFKKIEPLLSSLKKGAPFYHILSKGYELNECYEHFEKQLIHNQKLVKDTPDLMVGQFEKKELLYDSDNFPNH